MKFVVISVLLACGIREIFSTANLYPKSYLCSNGLYIRNDFVCDGINNCGDSSDEFSGCNLSECGPGTFFCSNNSSSKCLPVTARCNTILECCDGSDELNCPKVTPADDWSIGRNTFLCEDGLRSIEMNYTCDGECNCFDCSDESSGCLEQNENVCNTCSQPCLPTPNGSQCACSSFEDRDLNPFCQEILHCSPYTKCEQKCVRFFNKEKCLCDENYQTSRDENYNIVCNNNVSHENVLLYSTANQVKVLNLTSNIVTVVQKDVSCLALTAVHNYVYCAVRRNNTAYVLKISQNNEEMFEIVKSDSRIIYSIGVDWITGNVYFTSNTSLSVCTNDGKICTTLKSLSLGDSYHLALAPRFGLIFWTISSRQEHEESKIVTSAMDGSNERVLISEDIRYPTSLVVDELTEKIYWLESDIQFAIKSVQFNGKNKKEWISGLWLPWNVFAFSVFGKRTFISTRQSEIHTGENFNNNSLKHIMDKSGASVKYLYAYNTLLQRTKISNPCKKSCTGLCLLRPSSPTGLNYTCLCEHMESNNNTFWCKNTTDHIAEPAISLIPDNPLCLFLIMLIVFLAGFSFHWLVQKCRPIVCKRGDRCHFNVRPLPQTIWSKNGNPLDTTYRISLGNFGKSLEIKHVEHEDEGNYTCEVSNGIGESKSHTINLQVLAEPYFTEEPKDVRATIGESAEFYCRASGNPEPQIVWTFNGKPLKDAPVNPRRKVSTNSIIIEKLEKNDTGNYGCNATNSLDYVYKDVSVTVLDTNKARK